MTTRSIRSPSVSLAAPRPGRVEVGTATVEELELVAQLDARCFSPPWSAEDYALELERADRQLWVARTEGGDPRPGGGRTIVGLAACWLIAGELQIARIATARPWRRRGIAAAMLDAVLREARRRGDERVTLEVAAGNGAAVWLYRSRGFAVVGRRPGYYAGGDDALLMTLELS